MGLTLGPAALLVAYLFTYTMHGAASPAYMGLMHREASSKNRATVLSMGSLAMQGGGAIVGPLLGVLAARTSIGTAMVVAGLVSTVGFICFLPARRREREPSVASADAVARTATSADATDLTGS